MNLFHKYQSRVFQFSLELLALLEAQDSLAREEVDPLARRLGLNYADQVAAPLVRAGILEQKDGRWRRSEEFRSFTLSPGRAELDYLQYILTLPQAELLLDLETRQKLFQAGGDGKYLEDIQHLAPRGEPLPQYPGREGVRCLLQAIHEGRLVRYRYRARDIETYRESVVRPWKLEYSAYDRRWWIILYHPQERRTIKARLDNLRDVELLGPSDVSSEEIQAAMERLLEPEPVVLRVRKTKGALERCFLVFENQLFLDTEQLSPETVRVAFQFYRFDRGEILRRLLYLGPAVELLAPQSLREELLELVEQALEQSDSYSF